MINSNNLNIINKYAEGLLASLSASSRRKLAYRIALALRQSNVARITKQIEPGGNKFVPRNIKASRKKQKKKMFLKIKQNGHLQAIATSNFAEIRFKGAASHIAHIHHYGLKERRAKKSAGHIYYPKRQLLGITTQDLAVIDQVVVNHLANI